MRIENCMLQLMVMGFFLLFFGFFPGRFSLDQKFISSGFIKYGRWLERCVWWACICVGYGWVGGVLRSGGGARAAQPKCPLRIPFSGGSPRGRLPLNRHSGHGPYVLFTSRTALTFLKGGDGEVWRYCRVTAGWAGVGGVGGARVGCVARACREAAPDGNGCTGVHRFPYSLPSSMWLYPPEAHSRLELGRQVG